MKHTKLGNTKLSISQIGVGGAAFKDHSDSKAAKAVIEYALKHGVNYIDTSPWYINSEVLLGEVLPNISRSKYIISSKCGRYYSEDILEWFDFSFDRITESIDASIKKLGCKYLDICFCHDIEFAPTLEIVINEALPAMKKAKEKGKIKHIGISGYPLEKLKSAIELSTVKIDVVLTYCKYTLNDIELLDYLPWFQEQGIGVINASPFAMGLLTDLGPPKWHSAKQETKEAASQAAAYCKDEGASLIKLALQFSTSNPKIPITLVGCENVQELQYNINVIKEGVKQEDLVLINTVREKFFKGNHSWEGIGEEKFWKKVKAEMDKATSLYWRMQNATKQ